MLQVPPLTRSGAEYGPANGGPQSDPLQRLDHAEAGGANFFRRHEHVSRVERAMADARRPGEVDRAGQLRDQWQDLVDGCGRVMTQRHVECFGRHVLFGAIRHCAFDTGGDGFDDRRVKEARFGRDRELVGQGLCLLGRDVEPEHLHRDEAIARRFVGTEDRAERANANLMQHPEGAEGRWWCECRRIVSGQFTELLEAGLKKCNTI